MTKTTKDPCRVVIPGRGLYMPQVLRLEDPKDEDGKVVTRDYKTAGCRILVSKRDKETVRKIKNAIVAASKKKFGKMIVREGRPGYPLLDGDEALADDMDGKKGDEFKRHYYLNCKSFNKLPGLVDADGELVEDHEEKAHLCVSGYYFKFSITFKGSDTKTNRVRCELNNIMFVKEGQRLDGGVAADAEDWGTTNADDYEEEEYEEEYEEEEEPPRRRSSRAGRASRRSTKRSSARRRRDTEEEEEDDIPF